MELHFLKKTFRAGVLEILLSRAEVLNSFHYPMSLELQQLLEEAKEDNQVRAVILSGEGRAFCAGQDLAEATSPEEELKDLGDIVRQTYNPLVRAIRHLEKPVLAAVNGVAAGAGANLALCCDIVFASEKASFIQVFSKIGVIPDTGGTFFLPRLVGLSRATALMMLADKIKAQEAYEMGMIYRVVPHENLMEEVWKTAEHLATQPTRALGLTKRALNQSLANSIEEQLQLEEELQREAGKSADYKEGVKAFMEKRPANFTGQ